MDTAMGGASDVKAEFARRRKGRNLAMLGLLVVLGVMLLIENLAISATLAVAIFGVDIVAMLALFVYVFRVWRCPACNKYLGSQTSSFGIGTQLTACPKCNAEFV
jgi:hypothetical protein